MIDSILRSTFRHFRGIGKVRELQLWESGINTWDDLLSRHNKQLKFFWAVISSIEAELKESIQQLDSGNTDYFASRLPKSEYYRIATAFPKETLFLDIETTGLSRYYDDITLIGWSIDDQYSVSIKGEGTDSLFRAIDKAAAIVTFNGSIFDVPFLKRDFPNIKIPICHIDLRFYARIVGTSGGQKFIEEQLGFQRPSAMVNIKGESAPLLWFKYQQGDINSLEQLIYYNFFDIEGMKYILDQALEVSFRQSRIPGIGVQPKKYFKNNNSHKMDASEFCRYFQIVIPQIKKKSGPAIKFKDLRLKKSGAKLKIVGIDLSGSAKRNTGWCKLTDSLAITKPLSSDEEIIKESLDAKPDLISIDSPLSLPSGRKTVFDDDPGRSEFGIMRQCERILKRRGINVYPSLIPSMQRLTKRGIELASHFRSLGIPVIESYPGAAQDILKIPRKGASTEHLGIGLERFGISGEWIGQKVTHDELDAITSAMVGLFFWDGRFEALGIPDEDHLIIPKLDTEPINWQERIVIGISGPIATGKTTAGRYLEKLGYVYGRYSQVIKEIALERSLEPSRENMQEIGIEVNKNFGQRWLASKLLTRFKSDERIVIDGLRFPEDHAYLTEVYGPGFVHLFIESPPQSRQDRYLRRGNSSNEYHVAIMHGVEQSVEQLRPLAHAVISNDSDIENFHRKLESTISPLIK